MHFLPVAAALMQRRADCQAVSGGFGLSGACIIASVLLFYASDAASLHASHKLFRASRPALWRLCMRRDLNRRLCHNIVVNRGRRPRLGQHLPLEDARCPNAFTRQLHGIGRSCGSLQRPQCWATSASALKFKWPPLWSSSAAYRQAVLSTINVPSVIYAQAARIMPLLAVQLPCRSLLL